jgi:hypothetical protein
LIGSKLNEGQSSELFIFGLTFQLECPEKQCVFQALKITIVVGDGVLGSKIIEGGARHGLDQNLTETKVSGGAFNS